MHETESRKRCIILVDNIQKDSYEYDYYSHWTVHDYLKMHWRVFFLISMDHRLSITKKWIMQQGLQYS